MITAIAGLIGVLGKIVIHFLKIKTPQEKKDYVKNIEAMSRALYDRDVDSVNNILYELREAAREGDEDGLGT